MFANLWQVYDAQNPVATVRRFWPAFVSLVAGTWLGVNILDGIDERTLLYIVGILVICFTLIQASPHKVSIPTRYEKIAGVGFCGSAGVIGGLSSLFGPMLILYLVSIPNLNKDRFVNTISFLYIGAVVPWVIIMIAFGVLDSRLASLSALAVIPLAGGLAVGRMVRKRVREKLFYRLVLGVLVLSGGTLLWRAWQYAEPAVSG